MADPTVVSVSNPFTYDGTPRRVESVPRGTLRLMGPEHLVVGYEHFTTAQPKGARVGRRMKPARVRVGDGPAHAVREGESVSLCDVELSWVLLETPWPFPGNPCPECAAAAGGQA
jgi:hypothetical protein